MRELRARGCRWLLIVVGFASLGAQGCRTTTIDSADSFAVASSIDPSQDASQSFDELLAFFDSIYDGDPESKVVQAVGEPDERLRRLAHLRRFDPAPNCSAGLWHVGDFDVYLLFDKETRVLKDRILVDSTRLAGSRRIYSTVTDRNRDLVREGMSETQVRVLFGKPEPGSPAKWRDLDPTMPHIKKRERIYSFSYPLVGSRDDAILVVFRQSDRRVLEVTALHYL